jgi:hypothetical protein
MMNCKMCLLAAAAAAALTGLVSIAHAGPVGIDGVIGSDWAGFSPTASVTYNATAAEGNFGQPGDPPVGTQTDAESYDIYMRDDNSYLYVAFKPTGTGTAVANFANVYFDVDFPGEGDPGSDVGFEITNNDWFVPGATTPPNPTPPAGDLTFAVNATTGVIEAAIANSFFTSPLTDGEGNTYPTSTGEVILRLSQAYGNSVVGGDSTSTLADDSERLGGVELSGNPTAGPTVPLPASAWSGFALLGGLALFSGIKRRRQANT